MKTKITYSAIPGSVVAVQTEHAVIVWKFSVYAIFCFIFNIQGTVSLPCYYTAI